MSATSLAACHFEPCLEPVGAANHPGPEGLAAEAQFREALWREYRLEAVNAGFQFAQAAEYANVLSPELGSVAGGTALMPAAQGWFYQSRLRAVKRTMGWLLMRARWEKSRSSGRRAAAGTPMFASRFRPWNTG